jgi:hypothetical protein
MSQLPDSRYDPNTGQWGVIYNYTILYCRDRNIGKRRAMLFAGDLEPAGTLPDPLATANTIKALLPAMAADADARFRALLDKAEK